MTKKIIKQFHALDSTTRILIIIFILSILSVTSMMFAFAASNITFSDQTPASGSVVSTPKPSIGVNVYTSEGVLNLSDLKMSLGSKSITPVLTSGSSPGTYTLTYDPESNLSNNMQTVSLEINDPKTGLVQTTNWSFTVDAAPNVTSLAPAEGSTVNVSNPKISVYIKDSYDKIVNTSRILKIDGALVASTFKYKGYSSGSGYVIQSYKEGTLECQSANLLDGLHTVELSIADINGYELTKTWQFYTSTKPVFSDFSPANMTTVQNVDRISVKVTDDQINPGSIVLKDNGTQIYPDFDAATGMISYNNNFSYGKHQITVSATDTSGNIGTAPAWSFVVDNHSPTISTNLVTKPGNPYEIVTLDDGVLKFNATLNDLSDITSNTTLKLDDQLLPADIHYEYLYDYETGEYIGIKSKKTVYVAYEGQIADGSHALTLTRGDILGNIETKTWTINVSVKPSISQWQPVAFISELSPVISAVVKDMNNTLNDTDIKMSLDGKAVLPDYDSQTGNLTFKPAENLSNESYHTVNLSVYDQGQPISNVSWSFYISTYPDMPDSNMNNCSACHTWNPSAAIPFQDIHKAGARFTGNHSNREDCNNCHNYITYPADCAQCHGPEGIGPGSPHGSTPGIKYSTKNYSSTVPFRVTKNREMWDCVICHQPGSPFLGHYPGVVEPTKVLKNHNIPELHKTENSSCNECHALSLTREHTRAGRVDQNNLPITCNTCHKSTDTKIIGAITNHKKDCAECHGQEADHASLHESDLNISCQECHLKEISAEHRNNPKTNAGKNYTCDTCHKSTDLKVKRTIAANSLGCTGCHQEGHNINLSGKIPNDITLYAGYQWSNLTEATIFAGDTAIPAGYDDGQVIISNRRDNISANQVWTFYKEELVAKGWILKSDIPTVIPNSFSAEFEKGIRFVTIKSYDSQLRDGSGLTTGRRIEIWYKVKLD